MERVASLERSIQPIADQPLASLSTLGIGGRARWYWRATSSEDVGAAHAWAADRGMPLFVLGGGSNLIVADEGFNGLVLHIAMTGVETTRNGMDALVTAAAGESWDGLVARVVEEGLGGIECLSGIPGTVGGTPIQNVGAYGQEVSQAIDSITVFDRAEARRVALMPGECGFEYRTSRFKGSDAGRFIVCDVTFRLRHAPPAITYPDVIEHLARAGIAAPTIEGVRDAVLAIRRRKGMVIDANDPDTRSVGSFFMNPVVPRSVYERVESDSPGVPSYAMQNGDVKIPAAWLIERSGFSKGVTRGRVGVSSKHPLAIVNRGGATARELVLFAGAIKRAVGDRFGITLRPEPIFVGFDHDQGVEYLRS